MKLKQIKKTTEKDFKEVNKLINYSLYSKVSLINNIEKYITESEGKRIRPLIVLLITQALGYKKLNHILLSVVIEFIHTATLLHDDVVDESSKRRGKITTNIQWGNKTAILVGDFLYSRAFQIMTKIKNQKILNIIAKTTNIIAEGEVLQLLSQNNENITELEYLNIIYRKTAILFETAASTSAILTKCSQKIYENISKYGKHLGMAYQLVDDLLDYTSQEEKFGKVLGNDLKEGKTTLPLIYLINTCSKNEKKIIKNILQNKDEKNFYKIQTMMIKTKAIEYTLNKAKKEAKKAKQSIIDLPNSIYSENLINLTDFIINRKY